MHNFSIQIYSSYFFSRTVSIILFESSLIIAIIIGCYLNYRNNRAKKGFELIVKKAGSFSCEIEHA